MATSNLKAEIMKQLTIVCDGSSLGNGRGETRAAAVAILEYQGKRKIVGEYLGNCTNQQAEVVAAALGLEALKEPCQVTLISDSQYVIKTMKGEITYQEFSPKPTKPILDDIDQMLGAELRFTSEELDFIINYDIKYRMGQAAEEEAEA